MAKITVATREILISSALLAVFLAPGCAFRENPIPANTSTGLIATPVTYYSTPKARLLGEKYKTHLDRIVERIVRNPKTVGLQFANNIASVGGIGFFTHSATALADERYLEVVLAVPDLFETNADPGSRMHRLFSLYGTELLAILAADTDIYQDRDVSGYGLNLAWRKVVGERESPRVVVQRAVAYFSKTQARAFLRQEVDQNQLFNQAIVFAVEDDGPMKLVSVRPQEPAADFRPPIREELLLPQAAAALSGDTPKPAAPQRLLEPVATAKPAAPEPPAMPAPVPSVSASTSFPPVISESSGSPTSTKNSDSAVTPENDATPPVALDSGKAQSLPPRKPAEAKNPIMPVAPEAVAPSGTLPAPVIVVLKQSAPPASEANESPTTAKNNDAAVPSDSIPTLPVALDPAKPLSLPPPGKSAEVKNPIMPAAQEALAPGGAPSAPVIVVVEAARPVAPSPIMESTAAAKPATKTAVSLDPLPQPTIVVEQQVTAKTNAAVPISEPPTGPLPTHMPAASSVAREEIKQAANRGEQTPGQESPAMARSSANRTDSDREVASEASSVSSAGPTLGQSNSANTERSAVMARAEMAPATGPSVVGDQAKERVNRPAQDDPTIVVAPLALPTQSALPATAPLPAPTALKPEPIMAPEPQVVAEAKIVVPSVPETPSVASLPILPQPSVPPAPKEVADAETTVPVVAASAMATGSLPRSPEPTTPEKSPLAPEARRARAQVEKVEPAAPQTAIIIAETESIKPVAQPAIELATLMPRETTVAPPLKPAEALLPEPIPDPVLAPAPPPLPPQPAPTVSAVPSSEQVASLRVTPADSLTEKKPAPRPAAKALSGFIVQVAFADTRAAQAWAEAMERRGFAVSVTETGEMGAVRVRLGNFVARDDAERQLRALRQEGLKGIVINLPQAFRPESTSAVQ